VVLRQLHTADRLLPLCFCTSHPGFGYAFLFVPVSVLAYSYLRLTRTIKHRALPTSPVTGWKFRCSIRHNDARAQNGSPSGAFWPIPWATVQLSMAQHAIHSLTICLSMDIPLPTPCSTLPAACMACWANRPAFWDSQTVSRHGLDRAYWDSVCVSHPQIQTRRRRGWRTLILLLVIVPGYTWPACRDCIKDSQGSIQEQTQPHTVISGRKTD